MLALSLIFLVIRRCPLELIQVKMSPLPIAKKGVFILSGKWFPCPFNHPGTFRDRDIKCGQSLSISFSLMVVNLCLAFFWEIAWSHLGQIWHEMGRVVMLLASTLFWSKIKQIMRVASCHQAFFHLLLVDLSSESSKGLGAGQTSRHVSSRCIIEYITKLELTG